VSTPEEQEALRVAEVERAFARKKPHELRFQPVNAVTAYSIMPPVAVRSVLTGEPTEREETGA
jgi:hypothetical protein